MEISTRRLGKWKVLTPRDRRLDALVAQDFKTVLLSAIADGCRDLVVELSSVEFMDSAGLGALVFCRQRMGLGGRICLAGAQLEVATLLRLTHIDKVFPLCEKPECVLDKDFEPTGVTA